MVNQRAPGWYADPGTPGRWRWWDGRSWTEHATGVAAPDGPTAPDDATAPGGSGSTLGGPTLVDATLGDATFGGSTIRDSTANGPAVDGPAVDGEPVSPAGPGRRGAVVADGDSPLAAAPGRRSRARDAREGGPNVFARRWAVLVGLVALLVVILVVAVRSHPPALYWQGEPFGDGSTVLSQGEQSMQAFAKADEGVVSSQSRCYFSLPTTAAHDVAPYLRCGPVLLPWSSPSGPWLSYKLSASRPTSSGVELAVALTPAPRAPWPCTPARCCAVRTGWPRPRATPAWPSRPSLASLRVGPRP